MCAPKNANYSIHSLELKIKWMPFEFIYIPFSNSFLLTLWENIFYRYLQLCINVKNFDVKEPYDIEKNGNDILNKFENDHFIMRYKLFCIKTKSCGKLFVPCIIECPLQVQIWSNVNRSAFNQILRNLFSKSIFIQIKFSPTEESLYFSSCFCSITHVSVVF